MVLKHVARTVRKENEKILISQRTPLFSGLFVSFLLSNGKFVPSLINLSSYLPPFLQKKVIHVHTLLLSVEFCLN